MKFGMRILAGLLVTSCLLVAIWTGCKPANEIVTEDTPVAPQGSQPATSAPVQPAPPASSPPQQPLQPAAGKATIVGHVTYKGDPPKPRPINFGPEVKCQGQHEVPPTDESLVVSADKSIKWVLVRIVGRVPGKYPPPTESVTIDQMGCIFIPHVLAVQTGQPVVIKNSDEVSHNVRLECKVNPVLNYILPLKGDTRTVEFGSPETGMKLKCDIHFWMSGFIHAIRTPFFDVTDADGRFKIENLPPGTYKLEAQHEQLGSQTRTVTVKEGDLSTVDFEFEPK